MLTGQDVLIVGAREGGYGASIGRALVISGARVFGTSLIRIALGNRISFSKPVLCSSPIP